MTNASSATMFAVDVGGTFTDIVAVRNGEVQIAKLPSDRHETFAPVLQGAADIGVSDAAVFNHASTHGLNAIITRTLPKIAFITTEGHRDMLDKGTVMRGWEHVTNPSWRRSFGDAARPLVPRYLRRGVPERVAFDGTIACPLDEDAAREQIAVLRACNVEGIAVCLLNAYANGAHERRVRELIRQECGDLPVSISSEVSPLAKEYQRASTTVIDAIMKLIYHSYTERLDHGLRDLGFEGDLNYGDSAGMLLSAEFAMQQPYRVVFSGPAGGTAASVHLGGQIGLRDLLCADVGGTSCDISVVTDGRPYRNLAFELEPDLVVNSLATDIETLGAGGGSIVWVNPVGEVRVGPGSAGSDPGPAAYNLGGTVPTMTDIAVAAGILDPRGFGGGTLRLVPERAEQAIRSLELDMDYADRVRSAWAMGLNNIVEGIFNVALRRGVDPREYSLVAYGAAGPMLLPSILGQAHVARVVVPPFPGNFSALGLLSGLPVYAESQTLYTPLAASSAADIDKLLESLAAKLRARIPEGARQLSLSRSFDARLEGQSAATPFIEMPSGPVTEDTIPALVERFHDEYERRNGNAFRDMPVECVTFRVQITLSAQTLTFPELPRRGDDQPPAGRRTTIHHLFGDAIDALEYDRADLRPGDVIAGPAIVREATSTTFMPPGQTLQVGRVGELVITQDSWEPSAERTTRHD